MHTHTEHTVASATKLAVDILTASRTYGSLSGLCQWCSEDHTRYHILAAAIKVVVVASDHTQERKDARKRALDTFTNTMRRIRQGAKPSGERDMRPYFSYTREGGVVVVSWKTPEFKAAPVAGGPVIASEAEGATTVAVSLEQAVARIRDALASTAESNALAELFAMAGIDLGIG